MAKGLRFITIKGEPCVTVSSLVKALNIPSQHMDWATAVEPYLSEGEGYLTHIPSAITVKAAYRMTSFIDQGQECLASPYYMLSYTTGSGRTHAWRKAAVEELRERIPSQEDADAAYQWGQEVYLEKNGPALMRDAVERGMPPEEVRGLEERVGQHMLTGGVVIVPEDALQTVAALLTPLKGQDLCVLSWCQLMTGSNPASHPALKDIGRRAVQSLLRVGREKGFDDTQVIKIFPELGKYAYTERLANRYTAANATSRRKARKEKLAEQLKSVQQRREKGQEQVVPAHIIGVF